jgi:hypothetical protein
MTAGLASLRGIGRPRSSRSFVEMLRIKGTRGFLGLEGGIYRDVVLSSPVWYDLRCRKKAWSAG